jgi:hypothetical protein
MARLTPLWLGDLLAAVMIATAVYCASRILYAKVRGRATHRDVDGLHVLMGIAMAGMLSTHLSGLTPVRGAVHAVWVTVFALSTAWFAYRAVRHRGQEASAHESGALIHVVGSAAMLYMLAVAGSDGAMSAGLSAPGMGTSDDAARLPEVGVLLAVLATGAAVLVLDRLASAGIVISVGSPVAAAVPAVPVADSEPKIRRLRAPRVEECCHLAMCVTTAYMLLAMFA